MASRLNDAQTIKAFLEAEAFDGPSLIIAYSHCIAHGIDMETGMSHQRDLVKSGYLTLYHYDPRLGMHGADHPLKLDSRKPTVPLEQVTMKEGRYAMLAASDPARAKLLAKSLQADADALAAVLGAAVLPLQSQAWGGPWGGGGPWGNSGYGGGPWSGLTDMFGDMDANVSSRGWGRGSGYGYPYAGGYGSGYPGYGYGVPYGYGAPYAAPYGMPAAPVAPAAPAARGQEHC